MRNNGNRKGRGNTALVVLPTCCARMSPPSLSLSPQDHSKIAVLPVSGTFCVGDINRASTQHKRYAQKDMRAPPYTPHATPPLVPVSTGFVHFRRQGCHCTEGPTAAMLCCAGLFGHPAAGVAARCASQPPPLPARSWLRRCTTRWRPGVGVHPRPLAMRCRDLRVLSLRPARC